MTVVSKNAAGFQIAFWNQNIFGWKGRDNEFKFGVGEWKRLSKSV